MQTTVDCESAPLLADGTKDPLQRDAIPALLKQKDQRSRNIRRLFVCLTFAAILAGAIVFIFIAHDKHWFRLDDSPPPPTSGPPNSGNVKRNVIFMVSDGFGPASETYARTYYQYLMSGRNGSATSPPPFSQDYPRMLPLDTIMVGQSRTRSANSWVTDSAAGATAFSCGLKSYNGAVGVNETQAPCGTMMEAAKALGYTTGIVVTSQVTDATPASFSSHVTWRKYESEIAVQQIGSGPMGRVVDLMFGGGLGFFQPNTTPGSSRSDSRDLLEEAIENGFKTVITDRKGFDELTGDESEMPVLGLFNDKHMNFEIDRDPALEPSLSEMAQKALEYMTDATADSEKGFFLLIEGSRIDMAAHENDAAAHAHEILAYQEAISAVKKYVDEHPGTVMISVSDHETGGLTLGRQLTPKYPEYLWYPEVVDRVQNSTAVLGAAVGKIKNMTERGVYLREIVFPLNLGVTDWTSEDLEYLCNPQNTQSQLVWYLSEMVNRRAVLGFATHGHTGIDVNLYAYAGKPSAGGCGTAIDPIRRNLENIELGSFMESYLGLAQTRKAITQKLISAIEDGSLIMFPVGKPPIPTQLLPFTEYELAEEGEDEERREHYHHDQYH